MIRFFYHTRNILGLILVISPLVGFLYIDYNFTLSMIFLCSIAAGIPLGSACYRLINFRLWTGLACIGVCLGALLLRGEGALGGSAAAKAVGMAFVGFYAGGLAAVVPANLMVNWFRASKTLLLGAVFSISITAGALLTALMERHTYLTLSLSLIMMLTGCLFFLQRPPVFWGESALSWDKKFRSVKRAAAVRLFLFIMAVSFAVGLSLFSPMNSQAFDSSISANRVFLLGLMAGAFAAALLSEFKSVYGGCILVIFLAELSVFYFGAGNTTMQLFVNTFSQGLFLSAMTAVIPIAVYYIYGPAGYNGCLGAVWTAFPLGLVSAGALTKASADTNVPFLMSQNVSIFLMFLLTACFFTIFSAWRHRFILLK